MRLHDGDSPGTVVTGPTLQIARSEASEAHCAECGAPIGMHPRWWFDGDDELVPYFEECSPYVGSESTTA
jgi:hypothetical protein